MKGDVIRNVSFAGVGEERVLQCVGGDVAEGIVVGGTVCAEHGRRLAAVLRLVIHGLVEVMLDNSTRGYYTKMSGCLAGARE
jgi:hypothetical protein